MVHLANFLSGLLALSFVSANVNTQGQFSEAEPDVRHESALSLRTPVLDVSTVSKRASDETIAAVPSAPRPPSNTKTVLYLHAAGASVAWAVVMPIGAAIRKITSQARYHAAIMTAGTLLAITAMAVGIVISLRNPKQSSFMSAHQILGLIIVPIAILQAPMGFYNHQIYLSTGKSTLLGAVHKYLGPALVVIAILNGYLGIDFAEDEEYFKPYVVTMVVWLFCLGTGTTIIRRWQRRGWQGVAEGVKSPPSDVVGSSEVGGQWA